MHGWARTLGHPGPCLAVLATSPFLGRTEFGKGARSHWTTGRTNRRGRDTEVAEAVPDIHGLPFP